MIKSGVKTTNSSLQLESNLFKTCKKKRKITEANHKTITRQDRELWQGERTIDQKEEEALDANLLIDFSKVGS